MLVKEVLAQYNKMVPFPWTLPKIEKAGYTPRAFFLTLGEQLAQCSDIATPLGKDTLETIHQLNN